MNEITNDAYNKYNQVPFIVDNIISYLINNDDQIWKLLYYTDADAWKSTKPNLTKDQKGALVYDGLKTETDCRVFSDLGQDQSWDIEASILRIAIARIIPNNYVVGNISIVFQSYNHYKISTLSNHTNRAISIIQRLLYLLNGTEIEGGLGRLYFDRRANSTSDGTIIGQIPYKGFQVVMCNNIM